MPDEAEEPRATVSTLSPELASRLFALRIFLSLANPDFYNPLFNDC